VNNPNNLGISESRNIEIQNAKGKYFAWLDSDDIATSDHRLEKQVSFLESHDDYCLCCGNMVVINAEESIIENVVWQPTNLPISWTIFWDNPVAQSSVMIRRSIFTSNGLKYSSKHAPAEDYDIWCQLTLLGKMVNVKTTTPQQ
jgi:glycosyltransferase involved in cell wall biosynthesis